MSYWADEEAEKLLPALARGNCLPDIAAALRNARKEGMEEAAKIAEHNNFWPQEGADIAKEIRAASDRCDFAQFIRAASEKQ